MRNRVLQFCLLLGLLCGLSFVLCAHSAPGKSPSKKFPQDRIDLKTETLVGKKLDRVADGPKGKEYHYIYRVQAKPTEKDLPRYTVNPQYEITHTKKGFQENDSITLLSDNTETATDSPIWVYDVTYVGSGERSISFQTTGAVMAMSFSAASSESNCSGCGCNLTGCSTHSCSVCNPCSAGDCYNGCPGCSCNCHETCNLNCDCEYSSDCPGASGHNCEICNPCSKGGCSVVCAGNGCTCTCHCKCTANLCANSSGASCSCPNCVIDLDTPSILCGCSCHKCPYKNCPKGHVSDICVCECHGKCRLFICPKNCAGSKDGCSCKCHLCPAP